MIDFFLHLFDPSEAPSSTRGGALSTTTGWLHLSSDMAIFFAYAVICTLLMIFLFRQRRLPHRPTIWMVWLFMLACGITRLVGAAMLYYPAFRLLLVVKILTAIVSLITVFAVARIFPSMFELESFTGSQRKSREGEERHRQDREEFTEQRDKLEQRATLLTVRDRRVRRALETSDSAACSWDGASGEFVWEVGLKTLLGLPNDEAEAAHSWSQCLGPSEFGRVQEATRNALGSGSELLIEIPFVRADGREGVLHIRAKPESTSTSGPGKAIVTGLVSFVPARVPA